MTSLECKAVTKEGTRCKRNATKDGYCKQHFDINKQSEQSISVDVMRNIVSDYIPYDELKELENQIDNLKINKGRIIEEKIEDGYFRYKIVTKIDDVVRKEKEYSTGNITLRMNIGDIKIRENNYDENEKLDGPQFEWDKNGELVSKENYRKGLKDGVQYYSDTEGIEKYENYKDGNQHGTQLKYINGNLRQEENYKNGLRDGVHLYFYPNGNKQYEWNYKNGRRNGLQRDYSKNGNLVEEENYVDGIRV
jgi:antitoxin component YwqK of YwqJK toxin-antitoxin module